MPTAPPFLRNRWVLGATQGQAIRIHAHADIAPDTFSNVFDTSFFDLCGQKRVGD